MTRNPGAKAPVVAGFAARMVTRNTGEAARGQTEPRVQRHHLLSPAPNPLYPQPNQDAVSMTTWPARKGGGGLQRKFSTSAGRQEDVRQRKNRLDGGGGGWHAQRRVLEPQTILPTVPRILLLPPRSTTSPPPLGHRREGGRFGRGPRVRVQRSAAAQTSCVW